MRRPPALPAMNVTTKRLRHDFLDFLAHQSQLHMLRSSACYLCPIPAAAASGAYGYKSIVTFTGPLQK